MSRFFNLLLAVLLIAVLAFATAPWFAFRALRAAAQYEDVGAITELVDFPAVRTALTRQVEAAAAPVPATAEPPSIWRDPLGVFRRAVPAPLAPQRPQVDKYLTTSGLDALARGYAPGAAPPHATPGQKAQGRRAFPSIAYWDPNRVRVAVARPGDRAKVTVFTWHRRGWFEWRLVAITLPQGERR